jgi:hypothetical protein
VFITATACALALTRRVRPERVQPAPERDAVWMASPPGVAQ